MDQLYQAINEDENLEFIRSNDPCEMFHSFLGKFTLINHNLTRSIYSDQTWQVKHCCQQIEGNRAHISKKSY